MVLRVVWPLMLNRAWFRAAVHNARRRPKPLAEKVARQVADVTAIPGAAIGLDSGRKIGLTNFRKQNQRGETRMGISRGALLRACLLASVPIAAFSQAPVVVEAESGTLGTSLTT